MRFEHSWRSESQGKLLPPRGSFTQTCSQAADQSNCFSHLVKPPDLNPFKLYQFAAKATNYFPKLFKLDTNS